MKITKSNWKLLKQTGNDWSKLKITESNWNLAMNQTEMDSSTYPVVYYDMFWYNTLNQSETHAYSLHTQYTTVIPILLGVAQRSRSLEDNFLLVRCVVRVLRCITCMNTWVWYIKSQRKRVRFGRGSCIMCLAVKFVGSNFHKTAVFNNNTKHFIFIENATAPNISAKWVLVSSLLMICWGLGCFVPVLMPVVSCEWRVQRMCDAFSRTMAPQTLSSLLFGKIWYLKRKQLSRKVPHSTSFSWLFTSWKTTQRRRN